MSPSRSLLPSCLAASGSAAPLGPPGLASRRALQSPRAFTAPAFITALLVAVVPTLRAIDPLPLGQVIDRVVCADTPAQAYALYVPSHYRRDARWPVIFCFDPGARGRTPVERLQAAAEKFGYIVAGSLNSHNGPLPDNAAAAKAMVNDVGARFALDPARVYTAGLSGGARVATAFALSGWSKGVIACSAGFPMDQDDIPLQLNFVFFGTAGLDDGNYRELRRLDDALADRKTTHRIVNFDGGHEWAPVPLLTEAVEWLELQAMRAGKRPGDAAFIQAYLQQRTAGLAAEPVLNQWRAYQSLAADFRGVADVSAFELKAKELGASRAVKDALKTERALLLHEEAVIEDLAEMATEGTAKERAKLATQLRQQADGPQDTPERRSVRRALSVFLSISRERMRAPQGEPDGNSSAYLEMAVLLRPDQPRTLLALARARAREGNKGGALAALEQAAGAGLRAIAAVESEPGFKAMRSDPRYAAVLAKIRANAAAPAPVNDVEEPPDIPRRQRER
jgi:hypothetical protein